MKKYFTIGMAGHIDHGKTSLTKALTNWDTDRLKEEKERKISIELGFAPLYDDSLMNVSIIDVPGHERFIRQMIAGVVGIDLVVLVIAADEGVMPQTREHLDILSLLGIQKCIVALTKVNLVDDELLVMAENDIYELLAGTPFIDSPILHVDSLTMQGVDPLREAILSTLNFIDNRFTDDDFRMPIDQVFTVKGQGTVVRGTVYDGRIAEGDPIIILPNRLTSRARQLQLFGEKTAFAYAGQRVAINLAGIDKTEVTRGDVLVNSTQFIITDTVDIVFSVVRKLAHPIKQRMTVKCHIGTAEVMGKIIFFDRKEIDDDAKEVLCQLRLDQPVIAKRSDRFILRRPSPQETIGGGWIINPSGEKYRFGEKTITLLEERKSGTNSERVLQILSHHKLLSRIDICKYVSMDEATLNEVIEVEKTIVLTANNLFTTTNVLRQAIADMQKLLDDYHLQYPMRLGINKAELLQKTDGKFPKALVEHALTLGENFVITNQHVALPNFTPQIPKGWENRINQALSRLDRDQWNVKHFENYLDEEKVPKPLKLEVVTFLTDSRRIIPLDQNFCVATSVFEKAVAELKKAAPTQFDTSVAKEVLKLSRKYLIPFLEKLDELKLTKRIENTRKWL